MGERSFCQLCAFMSPTYPLGSVRNPVPDPHPCLFSRTEFLTTSHCIIGLSPAACGIAIGPFSFDPMPPRAEYQTAPNSHNRLISPTFVSGLRIYPRLYPPDFGGKSRKNRRKLPHHDNELPHVRYNLGTVYRASMAWPCASGCECVWQETSAFEAHQWSQPIAWRQRQLAVGSSLQRYHHAHLVDLGGEETSVQRSEAIVRRCASVSH